MLHTELLPGRRNKKHGKDWINSFEMYVFPTVGDMLVTNLKPSHFAEVLRPIWLTKKETATRVKQRCHAVMAWSWAHDYIADNPLDVVSKLLPAQKQTVQHQPAMPCHAMERYTWILAEKPEKLSKRRNNQTTTDVSHLDCNAIR